MSPELSSRSFHHVGLEMWVSWVRPGCAQQQVTGLPAADGIIGGGGGIDRAHFRQRGHHHLVDAARTVGKAHGQVAAVVDADVLLAGGKLVMGELVQQRIALLRQRRDDDEIDGGFQFQASTWKMKWSANISKGSKEANGRNRNTRRCRAPLSGVPVRRWDQRPEATVGHPPGIEP